MFIDLNQRIITLVDIQFDISGTKETPKQQPANTTSIIHNMIFILFLMLVCLKF
jgi:hypothetical protein